MFFDCSFVHFVFSFGPEIKPRASHLMNRCCTTELHPTEQDELFKELDQASISALLQNLICIKFFFQPLLQTTSHFVTGTQAKAQSNLWHQAKQEGRGWDVTKWWSTCPAARGPGFNGRKKEERQYCSLSTPNALLNGTINSSHNSRRWLDHRLQFMVEIPG